jgi:ATP-dependent DNA helicase RecQ
VYHFNLPKSLENYAQEIGRAGRDGRPSTCEMLASADDLVTLENFTFGDTPTPEAVAGILKDVLSQGELFDVSTSELSNAHDTRPLVVETLLTYLQLDGYLASTGPFYSEYKFQSPRPLEGVFAKFDANRGNFLRKVFKHARKAKTWSNIDVHATAQSLVEPRERVVAAINYLEEQGDLILQVAGVRHGYRLLRLPDDLAALTTLMTQRFADREARDIVRLNEVLAFASHDGCKTARLLTYFGEPMPNDCGHCGWCRGHRPGPVPPPSHRTPGDDERQLIDEVRAANRAALASPRQLARFLCGIPSPSVSRAKLTKHDHYGALAAVPFREVYAFVTANATSP